MAKEDAFNAAVSVFSMYGGLFKDVAREFGMEKALAFHAKQGDMFGAHFAAMLKEKLGSKEVDMRTLSSILKGAMDGFGFTYESVETPTSIVLKNHKCPIYDGFRMAGLDHKTINSMCSQMSQAEYEGIKKIYPMIQGRAELKTSPDGYCTEEFIIKK